MANTSLFASMRGKLLPATNTVNAEAAPAYALESREALAQLAATGCLNRTYYATAENQLEEVLRLAQEVDAEFIGKTAIYARRHGFMKDMPALLLACLTVPDSDGKVRSDLVTQVFGQVIDNGRMLRTFVQIMRSGVVGRKSLGSLPKRLVQNWLTTASDRDLIRASVGNAPSLGDVIKMVHPKPSNARREALFGYFIGRDHIVTDLPQALQDFERFKSEGGDTVPDVPFQMLTALDLTTDHWTQIAMNGGWHMVRMNLNTFARHGVFKSRAAVNSVADRLRDVEAIRRAKVFPYQIMAAYLASRDSGLPAKITRALKEALEISLENVPGLPGHVVVCPDVSGSMRMSVTGYRRGATSKVRCIDVAGLMASVVMHNCDAARVMPFEVGVCKVSLKRRDDVLTKATKLAAIGGGGTNCSAPLIQLNRERAKVDLLILVSDNESWADVRSGRATAVMREWARIKVRNPNARMVCLDIVPNVTTQAMGRDDVLNIGGFSDRVFQVIARFAAGNLGPDHWVGEINGIEVKGIN